MTYGEYKWTHYRPQGGTRTDWYEFNCRSKEMQIWCNEQKFDHWGFTKANNDLFWFSNEEDYLFFVLRWGRGK